jgi:hypothetical protein
MMINMSKTKIVLALVAVAALALIVVGLASAQSAANQTYAGSTASTRSPNGGFLGWIGNCLGFRNSQSNGNQNVAPQVPPTTGLVPAPNQGNYGYRGWIWIMLSKTINIVS